MKRISEILYDNYFRVLEYKSQKSMYFSTDIFNGRWRECSFNSLYLTFHFILRVSLVIIAHDACSGAEWRRRFPIMEGTCKYAEKVADSRQGNVLQFEVGS
jgi:hypothetical protein